jgi:hypothetical protein
VTTSAPKRPRTPASPAKTVSSDADAAAATARKAKPVKAAPAASKAAPAAATKAAVPASQPTHKREKLVRDSFTIPKGEYEALIALKARAIGLRAAAKKSELLRAGIKALATLDDASFLSALKVVPAIKTGRPAGKGQAGKPNKGKHPAAQH